MAGAPTKIFMGVQVANDLLDMLDERQLRTQASKRSKGNRRDADVRPILVILQDRIADNFSSVKATKLVPLRPRSGTRGGYHIVFSPYGDETTEIVVNGTLLGGTWSRLSTNSELESALVSAFGSNHGIGSGIVAGNLFFWNVVSVASSDLPATAVTYRPKLGTGHDVNVSAFMGELAPQYEKGGMFHCLWMSSVGFTVVHLRPPPLLVELAEDLDMADTGLELDLPSALANIIVTDPDTGADVVSDNQVRCWNRARNVSFEMGLRGLVEQARRRPLFLPIECPGAADASSSSWEASL